MGNLRTLVYALTSIVSTAALAHADEAPLSVCDALARRAEFNHKVIAIRGVFLTDEGSWLMSNNCGTLATPEFKWPAMIWIESSKEAQQSAGFHDEPYQTQVKNINAELQKQGYDRKRHEIWLTYIGRFETFEDLRRQGKPVGYGFGHLNSAPARLIVNEAKDLQIKPSPSQAPMKKTEKHQ